MNLDLIRAIDKWVGIPACFAVSMAHKVRDYFKAQPGDEPRQGPGPKRVLFLELSEMGDPCISCNEVCAEAISRSRALLSYL
jgi:hypothetical protein